MYRIILKLLLIKGYNNETIQATLAQHNPPDPAGFLNNYLDNEEKTIAHKLGMLCVDDATFIQWTDYVNNVKMLVILILKYLKYWNHMLQRNN